MCAQSIDNFGGSDDPSVSVGAYGCLGAHKKGTRIFFGFFAPYAERVFLVGSFNDWCESNPLSKKEKGIWVIGIHQNGISDGDAYKYKVYRDGKAYYYADPYAMETDGFPYYNSVYRDAGRIVNDLHVKQRHIGCFERPLNIYEIGADRYTSNNGDYASLAREILPYVLQMGYTHVSMSEMCEMYYDSNDRKEYQVAFAPSARRGGAGAFYEFVRLMHDFDVGVLLDWNTEKYFGDIDADVAFYTKNALYWLNCYGIDGFVLNEDKVHGEEFFERLVHSVRSEIGDAYFISKNAGTSTSSAANESVKCCYGYIDLFFNEQNNSDAYRINAAAMAYLLLKDGMMITRMGNEIGISCNEDKLLFSKNIVDDQEKARFQLFSSELNNLYLSYPQLWRCGDCPAAAIQCDHGGIRILHRGCGEDELVMVFDISGKGGDICISETGEWQTIFDSDSLLSGSLDPIQAEFGEGAYLSLSPYGVSVIKRSSR